MSNKIKTVSIGDLPIATELDDADELLLRDVSASLPEQATSRLSIETLRAAIGGSPDRIESASGEAFVETTDDFAGEDVPGSIMRAESNGAAAQVFAVADPGNNYSAAAVSVGPEGDIEGVAGFVAEYDASLDAYSLWAAGAPLEIEEPTESNHAATKGYVDTRYVVEWWEPVWTPVENVDSVSNVECQYTRAYRAAGGSLVTLEGTIEVTPDAAGQCAVQVNLPIARVGSDLLAGTAMAMEVTPPVHVVAVASVDISTLTLGFIAEDAVPYIVGFRASYRAA